MPDDPQPTLDPWDQQPGEGPKPYAAFTIYRDLGPHNRGIRDVASQLNKSIALIARWSREHKWVARVAAWDARIDRAAREATLRKREEMIDLHAGTARQMMQYVARRLLGADGVARLNANELTAADLVRMMEAAAKLERLSRGVPTEHVEQTGTVDHLMSPALREMIEDEDLAAEAEELAIKMARRHLEREARGE